MTASLGLITPEINRLDLNGCVGCGVRGLSGLTDVLLAIRSKIVAVAGSGYLIVGTGGITNDERLAVNDALFDLNAPTSFATTSTSMGRTVVGNPTPVAQLLAEIDSALKSAGVSPPSAKPKWLMPVAIGAGVLVLGVVVIAATRKR